MFIDTAKIKIKAGNGGNGAMSFHREKYVTSGGPDGGDGGRGGNIVFQADSNLSTLADFRYKKKYIAQNGQNGKATRSSGKSAPDLIIKVPKGTLIKDCKTGKLIADIFDDTPKIIARGGKGGFGNMHFATPTRQAPRFAKPGMDGDELEVTLELKLLADVGLVGYPNIGKSTLISVVSQAKPIIADYHFTTITPVLGVVNRGMERSFVMADIPGLIEGAKDGLGLGHQFLRHVERCRLLVHVVDISGSEGRDPVSDFETINNELKNFNPELSERPMLVAGNKCDLATDEQIETFKKYVTDRGFKFFPIMAAINYGTEPLLDEIEKLLAKLPPVKVFEPDEFDFSEHDKGRDRSFTVEKCNGRFYVQGKWLIRLINSINFDDHESLQYFQKVLVSSGITQALYDAGVKKDDTVDIHGYEFDFVE